METIYNNCHHDSTNRLVAMHNPAYLQVSYHYDGAGRLLNRILSNGAQTDYQYDKDNRLTSLKNLSANKTVVEHLNYQRDNIGNITRITNTVNGKITAYSYNARYQLTNVNSTSNSEGRSYSYDAVGNRKTMLDNGITYYYNHSPGNRLTDVRTTSPTGPLYREFSYDDAGRVTAKRDGAGNILYLLNYTGKGRVYASFTPSAGASQYGYDPNDYRIKKGDTLYHLEGEHLEATYDSTGTLQNKYLRGVIVDEIVNGYHYNDPNNANDWTNYTFHHDHLNSITALTGHAGSIEETTTYDAFGSPSITLPGTGNDLLYTGREYDRETRLYYYRARYYDPEVGRFLSEDPIGFKAGVNFYAYVNNNPINFNDPSGKILDTIADIAFIGADIGFIIKDGPTFTNVAALGLDIVGAAVPFVTGAGAAFKAGNSASDLARVIPTKTFPTNTLGRSTDAEVFVTRASSIDGLHPNQIANRLTIPDSNSFNIVQFPASSVDSLKVPSFSDKPGFIPGGFTKGGAPEFTVPNGVFPQGSTVTTVSNRTNGLGFGLNVADQFNQSFGSGAGGGFVLYPSKPNTNTMSSVYSK